MKAEIVKEFTFEAAHHLPEVGPDHKCSRVHGHLFKVEVAVEGEVDPVLGWVMDFGDLKAIVKENIIDQFDHALILGRDFPSAELHKFEESAENIVYVDYQPTSENMLVDFAKRISLLLPPHVKLCSLRLRETNNSYAEWFAADNS